jgi:putative ABC transport system substrate-binding protein
MRRRDLITLLGAAAAAWPLTARAQQPVPPLVGVLSTRSAAEEAGEIAAFRRGLLEAGFAEGQVPPMVYRYADGHYDRLPGLAAELVRLNASVLFASSGIAARAAKAATSAIPIVFNSAADPVQLGLATRLDRPDGNLTGFTSSSGPLEVKRIELLHELVSKALPIAILINDGNPIAGPNLAQMQAAAQALGLPLVVLRARTDADLEKAFFDLRERKAGALLVATDPFFGDRQDTLVAMAAATAVPAMYARREFVAAGGLISYGASLLEGYRLAGVYVGRILKGARVSELPIQRPTKFELVINLKAAKALALDVPTSILLRADEVIE